MTKSESLDIEVGKMYFRYADHFPSRISSMCKLSSVVKVIEEKLTKRQLNVFKKDIFGHFLECRSFPFSGVILHNFLLRQVAHEEDSREDQLWFQIGKHLIRLSIVEWCLVTGLSYSVDTKLKNNEMEHRLRNTYFGGVHCKINVNEFDALFKKLKFEEMDDMDALKIALFYFVDRVLNARKNHCQINFDWLNQVDDIEYFRKRPWGLDLRSDRRFAINMVRENEEEYSPHRAMEAHGVFENQLCRDLFGDVLQTFEPNSKESSRKYWLTVKDYMPTIPDWHQPSINAMSSVTRQSDEHDDIPNPTPEQRHDTSEDEVAVDDHQEQSMTDVDMLLIPVNLDGAHWVLARVDFQKNKVWIYDSLLTFRDDKGAS
ncbi:hypothetical protein CUMW_181630 [Citrus unshiu]|uniref:Ubiquitin-like protease family profile domain-containing protein n=2 Tax=Citrus unshiu TaxID=55188 RepID=A0A2H5PZF9_CITUN|nr:hypothetical protein CUMW_181630 [Citrus unshiu]